MNKGAILSLLVAGLVTGSYIEFQVNQRDDVVAVIEVGVPELPLEAVEWSPPVAENFQVEASAVETLIRFLRVEPITTQVILEGSDEPLRSVVTRGTDIRFLGSGFEGVFVAPGYLGKVTLAFDVYRDGEPSGTVVVVGYRPTLRVTPERLFVRAR